MAWTRWIDNETDSLNQSIQKFLSDNEELNKNSTVRYENLKKTKVYSSDQLFSFNGQSINYNVVTFSLNSVVGDNITQVKGTIIIYSIAERIHYIINRNSDAKKFLRLLLNYKVNNAILEHNPNFNNDIFLWCVKRVFERKNIFTLNTSTKPDKKLVINSILGMKGQTSDLNKLTATGSSVLNLVSTLALLLESHLIEQTKIRLEYTNHNNLEIGLNNKGVIDIDFRSYIGQHNDNNEVEKTAKIVLLAYLEVIPALIDQLEKDQRLNKWNHLEKSTFLTNIEKEIGERINKMKKTFLEEQGKLNI
ncbi:hypothetical protein [Exiguobacterium sp. s194]|uniref:hypothetical protein n=1 Tax=Exiguobacterium sp. s194 TaxID=2751230 RepID=UPI001BEA5684|nr:hypothetical protein [Exiguobacterium sp. s194]